MRRRHRSPCPSQLPKSRPLRGRQKGQAVLALTAAALLAAGCTSSSDPQPTPTTSTRTVVRTSHPAPGADYRPPPARFVPHLRPGEKPPVGEVDRRCPYIKTGLDQDGYHVKGKNVADIVGSRIYRTTVLADRRPVGCRFYFYSSPFQAEADIVPRSFDSHAAAYNAMVRTAEAGRQARSFPHFAPGVVGIAYRTKFFNEDGSGDWAFVFAENRTLVVVHTDRNDTTGASVAQYLARAIVSHF